MKTSQTLVMGLKLNFSSGYLKEYRIVAMLYAYEVGKGNGNLKYNTCKSACRCMELDSNQDQPISK